MQLSQSGVIPNNRYLGSGKNFPTLFPSSVCRNNSATFNKSIRYPLFLYLCSAFSGDNTNRNFFQFDWLNFGMQQKTNPFCLFFSTFHLIFFFVYFLKQGALLHQCGVGIANRGQCCLDESAPESVRRNALQESDVVLPGGKLSSLDYTTFLKLLSVNGLV